MKILPRLSAERGNADHGWLKSFHTFDFASYQGSGHDKFGALRVINEDRVAPKTGFGQHSHREFEIFSYIVSGELQHNDSMGNTEIMKRGDIQLTSAGTGISHSEKAHGAEQVHFLQIWSLPSVSKLTPAYFTRHFTDAEKKDQWARIVAPVNTPGASSKREDTGPAPVQSPLTLYSTLLSPATSLPHTFQAGSTKGYIHVIQTSGYNVGPAKGAAIKISGGGGEGVVLKEGDAAYIMVQDAKELKVENVGDGVAEVLLFELA
ncbi:pirin domain-containing protein [Athelia psychrophila]|uniref:Pirin domain-containing protein n=1 Tax=Athelia psychrophila TaxID=1759441 RepID=A0A166A157_9AGAM|nr:pirin domain-containing protein [Fibularhizoctonia sp. CBS 109695]